MTSEHTPAYSGSSGQVSWKGVRVPDEALRELRGGALQERLLDLTQRDEMLAELQALSTTSMATTILQQLLESQPDPLAWEVGEALAEALLERHYAAIWPWNTARDRRSPNASLQGADLVGFVLEGQDVVLLFGEVKTSSDSDTPPNVLYGKSGLTQQLENLTNCKDIHWTLLRWLQARCKTPADSEMYRKAVQRFLQSGGRDFRLIGCLMRDTSPHELDLMNRAKHLSDKIEQPTSAQLLAWYFPDSATVWPTWVEVPDSA
jgi:hypothetical protein